MLKNRFSKSEFEVGIDEAGRGCIAGPVTASAVILPKGFNNKYLNDSKKLSEKKRLELKIIIEKEAVDYSVFFINAKIIKETNPLSRALDFQFLCYGRFYSKKGKIGPSLKFQNIIQKQQKCYFSF